MLIVNPYQVSVLTHTTCPFHQNNPGAAFAGCTCHSSYGTRTMTVEERQAYDAKIAANRCPHCGQQIPNEICQTPP